MATAWQVLRSYHLPGRDKRSRQRYPVFPASTPNLDQKLDLLAVTIVQGQRSPAQKKTDQGEKTPKTDRFALNTASAFSAFSLPLPVFILLILLIRTRTRNLLTVYCCLSLSLSLTGNRYRTMQETTNTQDNVQDHGGHLALGETPHDVLSSAVPMATHGASSFAEKENKNNNRSNNGNIYSRFFRNLAKFC